MHGVKFSKNLATRNSSDTSFGCPHMLTVTPCTTSKYRPFLVASCLAPTLYLAALAASEAGAAGANCGCRCLAMPITLSVAAASFASKPSVPLRTTKWRGCACHASCSFRSWSIASAALSRRET